LGSPDTTIHVGFGTKIRETLIYPVMCWCLLCCTMLSQSTYVTSMLC